MFSAMVLKGLPQEYETMVTMLNHGERKDFYEIKQALINFASNRVTPAQPSNSAFHVNTKNIRCHACGKLGHMQAVCRSVNRMASTPGPRGPQAQGQLGRGQPQRESRTCFNCNKVGHIATNCRSRPQGAQGGRGRGRSHYAQEDHKVYTFMSKQECTMDTSGGIITDIIVDSGCTGYMLKDRVMFTSLDEDFKGEVGNANQSQSTVDGRGTAELWLKDSKGETQRIVLTDALYVPSYSHNLLSVKRLNDAGVTVNFGQCPSLTAPDGNVFPMSCKQNLFVLQAAMPVPWDRAFKSVSLTRWHQRLGHGGIKDVTALERQVQGMEVTNKEHGACDTCATQKAKRAAVSKEWGTRANARLEIVHMDVIGPLNVTAINGARYGIGFIDSFSRFSAVYLMKTRDECLTYFRQFIADVGKPGTLVTDGAKEFTSGVFEAFCRESEIRHEFSAPYFPEDNGKIERVWGTVMNMARCMVDTAGMSKEYWGHALKGAFYIKNRSLHSALGKTPFEAFYGQQPDVSHLRTFGCTCFLYEEEKKKLDARATKGVFLGYSTNSKVYIVAVPDCNGALREYASRSVTFDEDSMFFQVSGGTQSAAPIGQQAKATDFIEYDEPPATANDFAADATLELPPGEAQEEQERNAQEGQERNAQEQERNAQGQERNAQEQGIPELTREPEPRDERRPARSARATRPPIRYNEYMTWDQVDQSGAALMSALQELDEIPQSAREALTETNWRAAMDREYRSLVDNKVWELVPRPKGSKVICGRWHYAVKRDGNGAVVKYKARFVAKGFTQVEGLHYNETFAPTTRLSTIRAVLACAAHQGAKPKQMDIKTAYLHAPIEEELYLEQPEGFEVKPNKDHVCRLLKSLYGLKQSGRNWYKMLSEFLLTAQFDVSPHDPCLFVKQEHGNYCYVCVWVDDIIYSSADYTFYRRFEQLITTQFTIGDSGPLDWFLGMQIRCQDGAITLNQRVYVSRLLSRFGMAECKAVSTPLAEKLVLSKADCPTQGTEEAAAMVDNDYRGLVGSINYLATTTRPDLAFAAHALSSYLHNPGMAHWTAAKHVLRFLRGTADAKLTYAQSSAPIMVTGFCDADYAGHTDTRRSTTGYAFVLCPGSAAVSWQSKLQATVVTSTTEAEVVAAVEAVKEAMHLQGLLGAMGYNLAQPVINCDSQSCIALSKNPTQQPRTKHYAVKLGFLREQCNSKTLLQYIPTAENPADILTKGLGKQKTLTFATTLSGH